MRQYIEPFIVGEIVSERAEEDMLYYYDTQGKLLAEVYHHDGQFCSATFTGEGKFSDVTQDQVTKIAEHVKKVFGQGNLQLQSVERDEEGYLVEF
ncbi:MAG: hypothetical protein ABS882_05995 [Lysinibacillus sp.]